MLVLETPGFASPAHHAVMADPIERRQQKDLGMIHLQAVPMPRSTMHGEEIVSIDAVRASPHPTSCVTMAFFTEENLVIPSADPCSSVKSLLRDLAGGEVWAKIRRSVQ